MKAKHVQLMIVKCIRNQVLRLPIETVNDERVYAFRPDLNGYTSRCFRFVPFDIVCSRTRTISYSFPAQPFSFQLF